MILGKDYIEPVPAHIALSEIDVFRTKYPGIGYGVWYFSNDILKYLTEDFPKFKAEHPIDKPYKWVVGHYFKIHKGRLCFFVIPTKLNTDTNKIVDRVSGLTHTSIRSEYVLAMKELSGEMKNNDPIGDDEAFDKGDMWP